MLENLTELLLPGLLLAVGAAGLRRKRDVYGDLLAGAQDGLRLLATLAPSLVLMLAAVTMLRESGFFDWLTPLAAPVSRRSLRRWCSFARSAAARRSPWGRS